MHDPAAHPRPYPRLRPSGLVQFLAVFRKEVLQTARDKRIMFLLVVAPLIQTVLFGFAVDFDVDRVPTVVVDSDRSAQSRTHARRLLADGTLERRVETTSVAAAERALDRGEAAAAIVLPASLERRMLANESATVQILLDGTDPNRANVVSGAVSQYFGEVGETMIEERAEAANLRIPTITVEPRIAFNPSLETPPFMIPGLMGMLLLIVTTVVTAMGMTRERETGTLEQILVTPIRPIYLLIGKIAPFLVIGLFDVLLVLTAGAYTFQVPLRGELAALFLTTLLYLMSTLGVGLFISTISVTQQQSFLGGFLFALPAILLSGVLTPIASMPDWLQAITLVNPVRYYAESLRAILLKGATLPDLLPQLIALFAIGSAIIALSLAKFRERVR